MIHDSGLTVEQAGELFRFFRDHRLFQWNSGFNDCEDRSNAICILLDKWGIPNYKGWVFTGSYFEKDGGHLINYWNYHVAAMIAVKDGDALRNYTIDPALCSGPEVLEDWAEKVTFTHGSVHFITSGDHYIFIPGKITPETWFRRNRQNYKWTIQGLSGINGVSKSGKAQLCFCKKRIAATEKAFIKQMNNKPHFLQFRDQELIEKSLSFNAVL